MVNIFFFFTSSGPIGSLNTKVLFKEYKLFAYVYQLKFSSIGIEPGYFHELLDKGKKSVVFITVFVIMNHVYM